MTGLRFFAATVLSSCVAAQDMPLPWTRPLQIGDTGASVYIAQNLLDRAATVPRTKLNASGTFDDLTAQFVIGLQRIMSLNESGILDPPTAAKLLECCAQDHYKDEDVPPSSLGYAYKIHVKLHPNRSIEVPARLIAGNGTVLFEFTVRAHGVDGPANASVWPYFSSCCDGLNQFSGGGNTPTGLSECDLNTPEGNATLYGPYPVNRMVRGLKGNAKWLMTGSDDFTTVRDGILMHTGQWANHSVPAWAPPAPMPNSLGCIHSWPQNIATVAAILQNELGVQARPNTDGALPYPFKPQGLLSVEETEY